MKRAVLLTAALFAIACGRGGVVTDAPGASDGGVAQAQEAGLGQGDASDAGGVGDDDGAAVGDDAASSVDGALPSRCTMTATTITCEHEQLLLHDADASRPVLYETPLGAPPPAGWPTVLYFQGSLVPGDSAFAATTSSPFGEYDLTRTIKALLDDGYAVVAPDASADGTTYWETNVPPFSTSWSGSPDDVFMLDLFAAMSAGQLGPIDSSHLYAMGISSGGFMTSRMAVSYDGRFRALVDHSGSYATCSALCTVPTPLPSDHPPTLFLHGALDVVVPMTAIQPYIDALNDAGRETKLVTDPNAGHQWLSEGPDVIPAWFDAHH